MITYMKGDILNSKMQTIVNPVNCRGAMGAGLALEIRNRYPDVYNEYKWQCDVYKSIRPGRPYIHKRPITPWILSFPTKDDWTQPATLKIVEDGLRALSTNYRAWGITSMAVPALGCGLGNLSWRDVKPLIVQYLSGLDIPVEVYEPLA